MTPTEKARASALAAAQSMLERCASFAGLHATAKPLFQKPMRLGNRSVLVRLMWPGVLLVCDPRTGEVLARSMPGRPEELAQGFEPGGPLSNESKGVR